METNTFIVGGYKYTYCPTLEAGYYSPLYGWHLLKKEGVLLYNYDELRRKFFNKK
jgi:hypothetical protein